MVGRGATGQGWRLICYVLQMQEWVPACHVHEGHKENVFDQVFKLFLDRDLTFVVGYIWGHSSSIKKESLILRSQLKQLKT